MDNEVMRRLLQNTVTDLQSGNYDIGLRRLKETLASLDQTPDPETQLEPVPESDSSYPDYDFPDSSEPMSFGYPDLWTGSSEYDSE